MKSLIIFCLISVLINSNLDAGQKLKAIVANQKLVEERLKAKRALQDEINYLRLLKKKMAELNLAKKMVLKKEFGNALAAGKVRTVEALLNSGINVNQSIDYCHLDDVLSVFPLIYVALLYPDLEMVKLLLRYGAKTNFSDGSLIYQMLENFNEDETFWISNARFRKSIESMQVDYLTVLQYLFSFCHFNKIKDIESRQCAFIWDQIMDRVKRERKVLGDESLKIISEISNAFFSI